MPTNVFSEIAKEFVTGTTEITDIVTFAESSWGLGIKLLPVQKFILKCLYGLPLDSGEKTIDVPDMVNEHILYRFNEKEFLSWLYAEKRCNVEVTEGKIFQQLILAIGRRGTKCRYKEDLISTTIGSITYGELCARINNGERVGIQTFNPETLSRSISFDLKADVNKRVDCFELETKNGMFETSSWNHPYLVWKDGWEYPDFVELSKIQEGDKIAVSACTGLFGKGGIGVIRAALLGHVHGEELPDCILKGTKEEISAFISLLFLDNEYEKSNIVYCSSSRKFITGIQHLLLKFGIHCIVSQKSECKDKNRTWTIRIVGQEDIEKFRKEINIFYKEDYVDHISDTENSEGVIKREFESIPRGIWNYVRRIMKERGLSCSDVVGEYDSGANAIIGWNSAPSRSEIASYGDNIGDSFLKSMGNSDVRWDEVASVKYVGKKDTVDIEVAGTHIIGGDIVSHNSTMASCVSNYEMYKLLKYGDPSSHYGYPPFTVLSILNVAPTDDQSGIVFDMTQNMAMRCPYMKDRSLHQTMTYFDLQTDPDIRATAGKARASLLSIAGGCSSNALRGRNALVIIMDEMAHFIDNNGRFSGDEVYKALSPSIAAFKRDGKILCISSPYAKFGKFYDLFTQSFQDPGITLSLKMYSAMVNPTIQPEILKAARKSDRTSFMCEYGGEFSDTITAWVEDENELKRCVHGGSIPTRGVHDVAYYYGIDLGFKNDGTAIAIVHKDPETKKIILDYANVWYSGASDVWDDDKSFYRLCNKYANLDLLRMSDIVNEIKELVKWFPVKEGIFDQNNGYALAELLTEEHLPQFKMVSCSESFNSEVYQLVKRLYAEELLELFEHPFLIKELLTLEGEKRAGSKVIVRAPARRGAHDDVSDAYCRAVWNCHNGFKERPKNISSGSGGRMLPSMSGKVETQASFALRRMRQHGEHPRGLYNVGRRASMIGR